MKTTLLLLSLCLGILSCKSQQTASLQPKETIEGMESSPESNPYWEEFTQAKEGFLTDSLFQVAISSVATDPEARKEEARSTAEQKAHNLLKTYAPSLLSDRGKKELREISKEGKLIDKNVSKGNRYFFLYQIQKKDLKRLITGGLE